MKNDKIINFPEKDKEQKNYELFYNKTNNILKQHNIDFDVIEVVEDYDHIFHVKIFIADSGTAILTCDIEGFEEYVTTVKNKILENPFLCPFCQNKNPLNECNVCGAMFIESTSLVGDENDITQYSGFDSFIENIHKKTFLKKEVFENFLMLNENIKDIIDGADIIYKGDSKWPIFCLSKNLKLKKIKNMNQELLFKLALALCIANNEEYSIINNSPDRPDTDKAILFKPENSDIESIISIETNYYMTDNDSIEYTNSYIFYIEASPDIYLKKYNLSLYDIKDLDVYDNFFDVYEKEMEKYDYFYDSLYYESFFSIELPFINFDNCKNINEMSNLIEENINSIFKDALEKIEISIEKSKSPINK